MDFNSASPQAGKKKFFPIQLRNGKCDPPFPRPNRIVGDLAATVARNGESREAMNLSKCRNPPFLLSGIPHRIEAAHCFKAGFGRAALVVWGVLWLLSCPPSLSAAETIGVGIAVRDVTPDGPIWLAGYAARKRPSEKI